MRKLKHLQSLQLGWDYPDSQPLDPIAEDNYRRWIAYVPEDRLADAEPMLTDDGFIRIEWRQDGCKRLAEIGPDSLFLCSLSPGAPQSEEFDHYDQAALDRFFTSGVIDH